MKTSKVKTVVSTKPYNGQNGSVFYHNLEMENGDKINIGKKKEIQIGWELNYEIIGDKREDGSYQQEYPKAKSIQPQANGYNGFQGSKKSTNNQTASFALSYAKDLVIGGKVDIKDILPTATKLNGWLKENS